MILYISVFLASGVDHLGPNLAILDASSSLAFCAWRILKLSIPHCFAYCCIRCPESPTEDAIDFSVFPAKSSRRINSRLASVKED